ncbi:hypothetical protein [uncultured Shewanella sp.]|uniref:hypothetical protein n=1 Tax=uncultured Shewanella sp. TaxID=173975 RepID=UPI00261C6786|nr:hypothetical protein [uncultured Shewanella sp.]
MRCFIVGLRVLLAALGCALFLQGCASIAIENDAHEDITPVFRENQTEEHGEVQKVSVIFPIGQEYEQHNDECWGHEDSGVIDAIE